MWNSGNGILELIPLDHQSPPLTTWPCLQTRLFLGRSPGLVVMGGDSCSEGRGFESQHRSFTGWMFFTLICCKMCNVNRNSNVSNMSLWRNFQYLLFWTNRCCHLMYPLVAPSAQYIPPTTTFFYLVYERSAALVSVTVCSLVSPPLWIDFLRTSDSRRNSNQNFDMKFSLRSQYGNFWKVISPSI